ncbi:MAG: hypothetical protein B7X41_15485, partial [Microbacterium sp. 14-71-5]
TGGTSAPVVSGTDPLTGTSAASPPAIVLEGTAVGPPVRAGGGSAGAVGDALRASGPPHSASSPPAAPTSPNAPDPWATPVGTGTSSSAAGSGGGSAPWFAAFSAATTAAPRLSMLSGGAADDALPSSPVFPTDVSPD